MAYICIKDVNTDFGVYKVGDIVSDVLGKRYSQFEKVESVEKVPVKEAKVKEAKVKETKVKDVVPEVKEELLIETSSDVEIATEDEEI